jgi:hypothetical protein
MNDASYSEIEVDKSISDLSCNGRTYAGNYKN